MECPIYLSVMYIWSSVSFKTTISLLIFHLFESVPDISEVLNSPTIFYYCQFLVFMPVNISFP